MYQPRSSGLYKAIEAADNVYIGDTPLSLMRYVGSIIAFALSIFLGTQMSLTSWNGMVYWYPDNNQRVPAAIKKVFDFSHLEGHALEMASYKRLVADAQVIKTKTGIGVQLGHFVIKDKNNKKQFACKVFDKVEMVFHSADMSVAGQPSVMTVVSDCKMSEDLNRIETVWIPMEKINKEKERDFEIQYRDQNIVDFTFQNIGDKWPQAWTLNSIQLIDNVSERFKNLQINSVQMRDIIDRPITLVWPND